MTRKKQSFPCYGMQWGATLYLYPLETSLEEWFDAPPRPEDLQRSPDVRRPLGRAVAGIVEADVDQGSRSRISTSTTS